MSLVTRILRRSKVHDAKRALGKAPTVRNYCALANEYVQLGDMAQVVEVCREGLELFPANPELSRLQERARELLREDRIRELTRELREAPRPALWRELAGTLLEVGRVDRAEELADEWFQATQDPEALLIRAHARAERFFADRGREDGLKAFSHVADAEAALERDPRPLRLHLQLASRVGAWKDARRLAARLLELVPGDPALEARFRTLITLAESAPTVDQALRDVERSGRLADDDEASSDIGPEHGSVRPLLQQLQESPGVSAAVYVRGGTALVQGPKGATAERTARAVRESIQRTRGASRRIGLGQPIEVRLEGDFGTLLLAPGELGAGALWTTQPPSRRDERTLFALAGIDPTEEEGES